MYYFTFPWGFIGVELDEDSFFTPFVTPRGSGPFCHKNYENNVTATKANDIRLTRQKQCENVKN